MWLRRESSHWMKNVKQTKNGRREIVGGGGSGGGDKQHHTKTKTGTDRRRVSASQADTRFIILIWWAAPSQTARRLCRTLLLCFHTYISMLCFFTSVHFLHLLSQKDTTFKQMCKKTSYIMTADDILNQNCYYGFIALYTEWCLVPPANRAP